MVSQYNYHLFDMVSTKLKHGENDLSPELLDIGEGDNWAIAGINLRKSFGHVDALRGATFGVKKGEVSVMFGDNGAGKSTLLRVLCGVHQPDSGQVLIGGQPVNLKSIRDAQAYGVDVIHQDLALAPDLSVVENMFMGHELLADGWARFGGVLARSKMASKTDQALKQLSINLPSVAVPVQALSGGQRQAVAVARAVMWSRTAILMDEPTAALGTRQADIVCETIRDVASRGLGVFIISHDIPRLLRVADTASVLRRGEVVLTAPAQSLSIADVVHAMVGDLDQ
jgi:simple sugar transport system ATP-binding protein